MDAVALSDNEQGVPDESSTEADSSFRTPGSSFYSSPPRISLLPTGWQEITAQDLRQIGANHLIVATLLATVAFTAGFTMPGGYNGNDGPNQGIAVLTREAAFKAFMVTDTIAMSLSISAVFIHFEAALTNNRALLKRQIYTAAAFIIYAAIAMVLAFVTGTYAVLAHSSGLAISVCVIGCLPLPYFFTANTVEKINASYSSIRSSIEGRLQSRSAGQGTAPKSASVVM